MTNPRLVPLDEAHLAAYRQYAIRCGEQHDDDELSPRELDAVQVGTEATRLLLDDADRIVGAAALKPSQGDPGRRWRILHADDDAHAPLLVDWVRTEVGAEHAYGFVNAASEKHSLDLLLTLGARQVKRSLGLSRPLPAAAAAGPDDVQVCVLTPEHDGAFVDLWRAAQHDRDEPIHTTAERLRADLDGDEVNVALAGYVGERLVATGYADVMEGAAWVGMLAVAPDQRGRGVGRRMLRELADWAVREGASSIELCVDGHNENAAALYLSEGYHLDFEAICLAFDGLATGQA